MSFSKQWVERLLQPLALALLICGAAVVATFAYLSFAPIKIVEFKNAHVLKDKVKPGEALSFHLEYCKRQKYPASVYPRIQGPQAVFFLPSFIADVDEGCNSMVIDTFTIPINAIPGSYRLYVDTVYDVTSFRKVTVSFQTDEFEVLSK